MQRVDVWYGHVLIEGALNKSPQVVGRFAVAWNGEEVGIAGVSFRQQTRSGMTRTLW
jgi:hypothetical protein